MKRRDLRRHLQPYSIARQRTTTINHAFASAMAVNDDYDDQRVARALEALGQDPEDHLRCVYCGRPAETWDHVTGLVKGTQYVGFGHTLGNLLPCCRICNSQKGNKEWREFLRSVAQNEEEYTTIAALIASYLENYRSNRFGFGEIREALPEECARLTSIQDEIIALMREADQVATHLRRKVRLHLKEREASTGDQGVL